MTIFNVGSNPLRAWGVQETSDGVVVGDGVRARGDGCAVMNLYGASDGLGRTWFAVLSVKLLSAAPYHAHEPQGRKRAGVGRCMSRP